VEWGVRLGPLGTSTTLWPIVLSPDDRWWWLWSSRWDQTEVAPTPLCSPQVPHDLIWDRTWSVVGSRRPTLNFVEYCDYGFMECDAFESGKCLPTFRRNFLLSSSWNKVEAYVLTQRWSPSTTLHGVRSVCAAPYLPFGSTAENEDGEEGGLTLLSLETFRLVVRHGGSDPARLVELRNRLHLPR
jgi:hypothetical protein